MLVVTTLNLHTKYEMFSFTCSKILGAQKFKNGLCNLDQSYLGWFVIPKLIWTTSTCVQNLKTLASAVPEI